MCATCVGRAPSRDVRNQDEYLYSCGRLGTGPSNEARHEDLAWGSQGRIVLSLRSNIASRRDEAKSGIAAYMECMVHEGLNRDAYS